MADYFEYPLEAEKYDAALSFETLHHFKYSKKQKIYDKLFHTIKCGGYYIECDYIACCLDEEILCLEQYEFKRKENHIPDDVFVHIDIPLTLEHQIQLMKNAGFRNVHILYENKSTMIIKAENKQKYGGKGVGKTKWVFALFAEIKQGYKYERIQN